MENKVMYVYQFTLEDGSQLNYKTQGIFFSKNQDDEMKNLVKNATLIESFLVDADGNRVEDVVEAQVVESEQE